MKGYIKLHRKILDNGVFADAELLKVFVWCILKANATPNIVFGRKVDVGQFITGRVSAAEELRLKPSTVYKRMQVLKKQGYISIDSNTKNSLITVLKYKSYQLDEKRKKRDLEAVYKRFSDEVYSYDYPQEIQTEFIDYWTEPNRSKTKLRYELEKTFDISRRLKTWVKRQKQYTKTEKKNILDTWAEARNIVNNG
jgi:DNA-binding transcriptional regulator YhcF (GntR family)